jgi:hypothetical protein
MATLDLATGRLKLKKDGTVVYHVRVESGTDLQELLPGVKVFDKEGDEIPDYICMGCLTTGDTLHLGEQQYQVTVTGEQKEGSTSIFSSRNLILNLSLSLLSLSLPSWSLGQRASSSVW